jgi:alpha-tubulin suppressor-like RCC1 family protein
MRAISSALIVAALTSFCLVGCGSAPDSDSRSAENAENTIAAVSVGDTQTCTLSQRGEVVCDGRAVGINDAVAISVGHDHACAIRQGGRVACFGSNEHGQLGDGTKVANAAPVEVQLANVAGITAGFYKTCAWTEEGDAFCWGALEYEPHKMIGAPRDAESPVKLEGLAHVTAVSLGGFHACALINDGSVKCWGANYFGQLGDGTETLSDAPVDARISGVSAIATGTHHTCAIAGEGVFCWGADLVGQLGDASTGQARSKPTVMPTLRRAESITAGGDHTCVTLKGRSAPRCWGYNDVGQVSPGSPFIVRPPTIPEGVNDVQAVASGSSRSCAIKTDGALHCWGTNDGPM